MEPSLNHGDPDATRTPAPRLRLIVAVLVAVVVVALGGLSFYRKAQTFQALGFEAATEGGHWLVTDVADPAIGLAPGDRIVLVNGQEVGALRDPAATLRSRPDSDLVVLRGEGMEQVAYELPPLDIDSAYLILALIGLAYLLIGFYTLFRDHQRPSLVFYLWCLTSASLYLASPTTPFDQVGKAIYLIDELARIFLPALTLHLFLIFPRPLSKQDRLGRLIPFLYLPTAFLLTLQVDLVVLDGSTFFGGRLVPALAMVDRLELIYLVLFSLAAVGVLVWRLRRTRQQEPFRQASWIAIGMAAGYLPFLALYVLPYSAGLVLPQPLTILAILPLALVPLTFAYAILRYKLWDIGVVVRDTAALSLTVLVGVVGFSLANLVINRAVPDEMAMARTLITFMSGLVIAGVLVPTRKGIGSALERLQYRSSWGRRRALSKFGREVLEERSLWRLCNSLIERLREGLEIRQSVLLLLRGDDLLPLRPQRELPPRLGIDDLGAEFWDSEVESLSAVEFPTAEVSSQQRLFAAGFRYAFPLRVRESRIGVLLVGYKEGEVPLSSDDLDLIRNLLNQAALGIENANLLEEVNHQLEEVTRLQEFNQGIIESSPAGIAVIDAHRRIHSANHAFGELTGIEPGIAKGSDIVELLSLESLPGPSEGLRETRLVDRDGKDRYFQISVAPLSSKDSDPLQVVVLQDVTQRVEMEQTLKEKERLASLGMLAAGVAHEVNTPITGISSYAQMLLADMPEDDPRREMLQKVEKQTFRAATIVNNLLEFSRDRHREFSPISMTAMLHESVELLKGRIQEKGIEIDWQPPMEDIRVYGNEGELQQVFTNLIVNALDVIGEGGTVKLQLEADDKWVWAAVEDNGPGISQEDLEKIFEPFYSTKLARGGTGLGLSISFNIVRRHEGDLRVVSQPGEGSRFIVELPRLAADPGAEPAT